MDDLGAGGDCLCNNEELVFGKLGEYGENIEPINIYLQQEEMEEQAVNIQCDDNTYFDQH